LAWLVQAASGTFLEKGDFSMNESTVHSFRRRLMTLAGRLEEDSSGLTEEALRKSGGEANGDLSSTPLHPADLGTDYAHQEVALLLLENDQQMLEEIDAALARIDARTFGACEECKRAIPGARLEAVPYARHCIRCAQKSEQEIRTGAEQWAI
jgi:RNA polymerase-binding transcription factor DksA